MINEDGHRARIVTVIPTTSPQDADTEDLVTALREDDRARRRSAAPGSRPRSAE